MLRLDFSFLKLLKIPTLLTTLLVLPACLGSIGSVEPPKLTPAPGELVKPCAKPVNLPSRALRQFEVENFWITDRDNLITCSERHQGLVDYYETRDQKIQGK